MSAYEEAWDAFRGVVTDVELDRLLKGIERETAHNCAEKITAYAADHITPELDDIVDELADVIRPEKESDAQADH